MSNQNYKFVSIDVIFAKLARQKVNFSEDDVLEWTGEALEGIGTVRMLEDAVAFSEVVNHQCLVPEYCNMVQQIAKNNLWTPTNKCVTPQDVIQETPNIFYQTCTDCDGQTSNDMGYVVLDGMGTPLVEYGVAYYRPYFDLLGEYYGWTNTPYYQNNYSPVRLATSSFFEGIGDKNFNMGLDDSCNEYQIIRGSVLRFSFSSGFVAIAYKRNVLDTKTGYPMIPDNYSHITAIGYYIDFKMAENEFRMNREGSGSKLKYFESQWQWYCGQASDKDKIPQGLDEHQNLVDQRAYMLPVNKYNNFFGTLARPEYRKWNDPDYRNSRSFAVAIANR